MPASSPPRSRGGQHRKAGRGTASRSRGPSKARGKQSKPTGLRARSQARQAARVAKMRAKSGNRWRLYYDIDGPRVRLGVLWFIIVVGAVATSSILTALVMSIACGAASAHALRTWRARGQDTKPVTALAAAAVVAVAGLFGAQVLGVAVMLLAGVAVVVAVQDEGENPSVPRVLARVGLWLQCTLPPAVAGGCVVLLADQDAFAAITLILIVSCYESGDYLIGSGSGNAFEGPIAGGVGAIAMTLAIASFGFLTEDPWSAVILGALVAVLAPLGQLTATAMLPHARSFAPALRRVDSLLLAAPVWYFGIDRVFL